MRTAQTTTCQCKGAFAVQIISGCCGLALRSCSVATAFVFTPGRMSAGCSCTVVENCKIVYLCIKT